MRDIEINVKKLLNELPQNVLLVAACKTRTLEEVLTAINAGIKSIGENYVQEAKTIYDNIGSKVKWHFIGHLQKNKVKHAVKIFDIIETVDSVELAKEIDKECKKISKTMTIFIEINSGREEQKSGIHAENAEKLIKDISILENIKVSGLMTMGMFTGNPEDSRLCFKETKKIFDHIKNLNIKNIEMKYLSMGMTDTFKIGIEEGANIVRIGTLIFGERKNIYKT
ncbi:MAG: YggS family pyridoxal phosphate-dependent enzyme [Spirochaetes bacterium]|nr:YggS family pyridoxal phosphate-dependent enzyme [Spirochaetota bacterium]